MSKPYFKKISEIPTRRMKLDRGELIPIADPERGVKNADVHILLIKVGSDPGKLHYHERSENIYIVLEGTLEVVVEGERFMLGPDEVGFIPPGVKHAAGNGGDTMDKVIEIYSPPGPDFHIVDE